MSLEQLREDFAGGALESAIHDAGDGAGLRVDFDYFGAGVFGERHQPGRGMNHGGGADYQEYGGG